MICWVVLVLASCLEVCGGSFTVDENVGIPVSVLSDSEVIDVDNEGISFVVDSDQEDWYFLRMI